MSLMSFFQTYCETRELHPDAVLRTHYYRNGFRDCVTALEKLAEKDRLEVRDVNQTHGEVYLLGNGFDCIVTIAQITPIESGIDLKVNYFSFAGLGRPKKKVVELYKYLDSALKFKGVSLHP
ncbi:MAG: hypothetical protein V1761_04940 [bacterium]